MTEYAHDGGHAYAEMMMGIIRTGSITPYQSDFVNRKEWQTDGCRIVWPAASSAASGKPLMNESAGPSGRFSGQTLSTQLRQ